MPELPTGTVTFLFTDIEGSTKQWDAHPQAMAAALRRHDALMREAIESNSGLVFKTVGDAFCAAFPSARHALSATLAAQRALQFEPWEHPLQIRVRMALHTGAAEERDGDYFGPPLNRVARLLSLGHGGQVLLSRSTRELVQDHLPPDATLLDLGQHHLRDLSRPEQVFQLRHPDLASEFLPLKSLDHLPNNLPRQLTSFIGREKEMVQVKALLEKTSLLTLTGIGGCGKTRLALQVAAEVLDDYPDGVWLIELASLSDPALVTQTVAAVLGVREEAGKPVVQTLIDFLNVRRVLLLLDNCEHVLDACALLSDALLKLCPKAQILASSREGLGIAGEQTYRVPSLSLPSEPPFSSPLDKGGPREVTPESLSQFEAVRLFLERATAVQPQFAITNVNAPVLAQLCVRLDGIPLAIELAAARMRSLSVEEINARLDNRFRLLTGGSRAALPRQQTLRALIDWSYDLLNDQEKVLLCRLSVFVGGWTLEAAERVAGDWWSVTGLPTTAPYLPSTAPQPLSQGGGARNDAPFLAVTDHRPPITADDVLDLLTSLVDKSLVVVEQQEQHTRYRLLETVRQYARDRLVESGEIEIVRQRHQACFVALAEAAEPQLRGPEQCVWLERLEREYDNLRAALAWDNPEVALRIAGALWQFWSVRGYVSEGREWLAGVLAGADVQAHTPVRARALYVAGALAFSQGDYAAARTLGEESLAIYRESEDRRGIANLLHSLGIVASSQGDYAAARTLYAESLAIHRESGDRRGIANLLHSLGLVASNHGDYAAARTLNEESLAIHREMGHIRGIANLLHSLGIVASRQGDYAAASPLLEESLALMRELGNKRGIANLLHSLGIVASSQGDYAAARTLYAESLAIHRELGNKRGIANSLEAFAAHSMAQQPELAVRLWGAAEALREEVGAPLPPSVRLDYDRQVGVARAALSADAFAAAWSEGRAMTLEQAIEFALDEVGS